MDTNGPSDLSIALLSVTVGAILGFLGGLVSGLVTARHQHGLAVEDEARRRELAALQEMGAFFENHLREEISLRSWRIFTIGLSDSDPDPSDEWWPRLSRTLSDFVSEWELRWSYNVRQERVRLRIQELEGTSDDLDSSPNELAFREMFRQLEVDAAWMRTAIRTAAAKVSGSPQAGPSWLHSAYGVRRRDVAGMDLDDKIGLLAMLRAAQPKHRTKQRRRRMTWQGMALFMDIAEHPFFRRRLVRRLEKLKRKWERKGNRVKAAATKSTSD